MKTENVENAPFCLPPPKTLKRDYVRITPLPDAVPVLGLVFAWITDENTVHPHSALAMRSPVEFRSAITPN